MQPIVVPTLLLTGIMVMLSLMVLGARRWLIGAGSVAIQINDRRAIEVAPGRRLLWTLAARGIYLPAACGGKGSCGQCRVRIESGCPELLPNEAEHIDRSDAARGVRLACMVRVRRDMRIAVAPELLDVQRWLCTVVSNRNVATSLKELVLSLPDSVTMTFQAGDYVLVEAPPHDLHFRDFDIDPVYRGDWERLGWLDLESRVNERTVRAYSLANPPQQNDRAVLVIRIATPPAFAPASAPPGRASSYLFNLRSGDGLQLSGPYGEFHATDSDREMVLIAGGAGIAPIRSIVLDQLARKTGRRMSLWFGARDRNDLCYYADFERQARAIESFSVHAALSQPRKDDGWTGDTGFIHTVVYERFLKRHPAPAKAEYYICGPPLMAAAVLQMLAELGVASEDIHFDDFGS